MKTLVDTSIYIDFLRTGRHEDIVSRVDRGVLAHLYFSSIVAHELLRGARTANDRAEVHRIVNPFRFRQRLLNPETADWIAAATVMRALRNRSKLSEEQIAGLVQDALLSVQARSLGARLVTTDPDFRLLRHVHHFELELR